MILEEISTFDFEYNPDLGNPKAVYPQLKDSAFVMQLQTEQQFYTAIVMYDFVFKDINLEIYNQNGELVQIRVAVVSGVNLFFAEVDYRLEWYPNRDKFVFSKVKSSGIELQWGGGMRYYKILFNGMPLEQLSQINPEAIRIVFNFQMYEGAEVITDSFKLYNLPIEFFQNAKKFEGMKVEIYGGIRAESTLSKKRS